MFAARVTAASCGGQLRRRAGCGGLAAWRPCSQAAAAGWWRPGGLAAAGRLLAERVASRGVAASASAASVEPPRAAAAAENDDAALACPICFNPLSPAPGQAGVRCRRCARTFAATPDFVDLTLGSGAESQEPAASASGLPFPFPLPPGLDPSLGATGTALFRSPLISYVYERGWRQGFAWAGFPGAEREFELAQNYLVPARGGLLVDMSCGSGVFTRRFAASGDYSGVLAMDYSEAMLKQTREFCAGDAVLTAALGSRKLRLVRADVARIPLATASVAGLHAGAALHCWPNPAAAVAEIARVLRPGGVFVGSTFLLPTSALAEAAGLRDEALRPLRMLASLGPGSFRGYRMWEEGEIQGLCQQAGLTNFRRERRRQFIMWAVTKPDVASGIDISALGGVST